MAPSSTVSGGGTATKPATAFSTMIRSDRALVDLGAVDPRTVDLDVVRRDCELLAEAVRTHPDVVRQALATVCAGASGATVTEAAGALAGIGLTERAVVEKGGGMLAVALGGGRRPGPGGV